MESKINKTLFGLVGRNISYSFSKGYFREKFRRLKLEDYDYLNFDLESIDQFSQILVDNPALRGLNVTIPYKEQIVPYLDMLSDEAQAIGAVNTIAITSRGLIGHNTDAYGFRESLKPLLHDRIEHAYVLGTGGASKAISHVLKESGIPFQSVSRTPGENSIGYETLRSQMSAPCILVNCTPLGTYPNIDEKPPLPYELAGPDHIFYDLVYNPSQSAFLKAGHEQGARCANGLSMLELQAEKAWEIWQSLD